MRIQEQKPYFNIFSQTPCCDSGSGSGSSSNSIENEVDSLILCADDDGRPLVVVVSYDAAGVPSTVTYELDGNVSAATAVKCEGADYELTRVPYCIDGVQFGRVDITQPPSTTVLASYWQDNSGAVVPDPTGGAAEIVEGICQQYLGSLITHKCMCDDVNGDGSNIVQYVEFFRVEETTIGQVQGTSLGTYADATAQTQYTPTNPIECDSLGVPATFKAGRVCLQDAGLWNPTSTTSIFSIEVVQLGAGVTFTDSFGNITDFQLGEKATWSSNDFFSDGAPEIVTTAGAKVIINYTSL